ncbi:MAG: hypothetical protein LBH90_04390 [Tannerella sp.]|jgi:hypothetical protein|nr:hypothetical protein [Tannerella sp.]
MAKNKNNRKSNKKRKPHPVTPSWLKLKHSRTYQDACYAAAQRIVRAAGEDDALLDVFSKRQRQELFLVSVTPPYVAAMPGHKVPKFFLRYIQDTVTMTLKREYFDEASGATWMDLATVGQGLYQMFSMESFLTEYLQPHQQEVAKRLLAAFDAKGMFAEYRQRVVNAIRVTLMSLSQPNFRIYGLAPIRPEVCEDQPVIRSRVYVTTHECQILRFTYHNRERIAFRVFHGPIGGAPAIYATFSMSQFFPGIRRDRELDVYIQSHAIHRLKERVDTIHPSIRTQLVLISLTFTKQVVRGVDGRMYIAYIMLDKDFDRTIGYFAFTIDGNNLLVLTFLPLLSHRVPEGHHLNKRLGLSQEDIKYLGMDRLSFFYDVDIEQIPVLKQVLFDELHLDYIRHLYNSVRPANESFNEKKTAFVKNFFRTIELQPLHAVDEGQTPTVAVDEREAPSDMAGTESNEEA